MSLGGPVHDSPSRAARRRLLPALALLVLLVPPARASDTQWWILDTPADHAKSEARGIVVRPDGSLEPGPSARSVPLDSVSVVWSAVVLRDGSVALGCDQGRILRWSDRDGVRPWARLASAQVLALAADGDGVVAGTGPDGLVYRVGARGDTALFARTGERYVWGLAPEGPGAWYAATGTKGRLLRVDGRGVRVVADTDESNLVSLLADGQGGAFAGGDSKGRVLHARRDGSVRTVFDAGEDEIRALAIGPDGALYAAALSSPGAPEDDKDGEPKPASSAPPGGRSVLYRIVPDSSAVSWWVAPQPMVFALAVAPGVPAQGGSGSQAGGVLAATGNRAALYRVEQAGGATQLLAVPQGQITALAAVPRGPLVAATSNPAVLWQVGPGQAPRGELLSMALDARRIARFGHLRWQGEAAGSRVELATRSGNTEEPDTTWSPWTEVRGAGQGGAITSPPARYLQWRLIIAGGQARVGSVETSWREQNQPPRVEDVRVAPQGQGFREGELQPRLEPVTQSLPGGQRVEYSAPSATTPRQMRDLPLWARGLRSVQWRASDPNGDPLRFRVLVREEGAVEWIELAKDLEQPAWTWDTSALPDGRYRLRVIAGDEAGNAVGEEGTAEAVSQPFTVDNTPPAVTALEARAEGGAVGVSGTAQDAASPLQRIEVSLDDGPWRAVAPEGGFTDERSHAFRARLEGVGRGGHTVSVRVVDLAGNLATRAERVEVRDPGKRGTKAR
jgi:hypothetical protein